MLLFWTLQISSGYSYDFPESFEESNENNEYILKSRAKRYAELSEEEIERLFSDFGTNRHNRRQSSRHRERERERPINERRPSSDQPRDQRAQHHQRRHHDGEDHQRHHHRQHGDNSDHRARSRQETRSRGRRVRLTTQGTLPTSFDIYDVTTPMSNPTQTTSPPKATILVGSAYERNRLLRPSRSSENFVESGQIVRLRGGRHSWEGRVEVFRDDRWGLVCDDDWELEDAHVVCRQLGFSRGAQSAIGGGAYGAGDFSHGDILMDEIECDGGEETLQECRHTTLHDCLLSEAASVVCLPNTGCDPDWISGLGLCYRLMPQLATFASADVKCGQLDAHLLTVESQQENDFVSEWLMAESNETHFFTAGQKVTQDGMDYWWWHNTLYAVSFTEWFPGWPPHGSMRQPSNHTGQNCLTLSHTFYTERLKMRDVNYFFWNDAPCSVRLPFICEKVARDPQDCYVGNGMDYRGTVHRTEAGTLCHSWANASGINPSTHPGKGLGDHNFCRNPDNDSRPWCWIDPRKQKFGFCAISSCDVTEEQRITPEPESMNTPEAEQHVNISESPTGHQTNSTTTEGPCGEDQFPCWGIFDVRCIPARWRCDGEEDCANGGDEQNCDPATTTTAPTTTPPATTTPHGQCGSGLFRCHSRPYKLCLPVRWRCDRERDCPEGEDEEGCESELEQVSRTTHFMLTVPTNVTNYHEVTYAQSSVEQCATLCVHNLAFVCRSFNYYINEERCTLYDVNVDVTGALHPNESVSYYEVIIQRDNCTLRADLFRCDNGKCIEPDDICNGVDDCNDFSDEHFCASSDVTIRLAGGRNEHEGRVEIRYHGEWGQVCDDQWDIRDAHVVCRQLGYYGATAAATLSHFGYGNGNFLLDDVNCTGHETTLVDCNHAPWRNHNCRTFESAGVICKVGKSCREGQYTCSDGSCISPSSVCDNESNCPDGSDEEDCEDLQIRLVGGSSPTEGRIEVTFKGLRGTVCDDQWDDADATVVCRMLGYSGSSRAVNFGNGSGVIWLDNVRCRGTEPSLLDCQHNGWAVHNCAHSEDAGIRCSAGSTPASTAAPDDEEDDNADSDPVTTTESPHPTCGQRPVSQSQSRIVGGYNARYGAYPWQAGILKQGWLGGYSHHCGATIIDDNWVISAAHCFYGRTKEQFRVSVGDWDLDREDIFEQTFVIEEVIIHTRYSSNTHDHDFALVKLGGTIRFSDFVQPACLPPDNIDYSAGTRCLISGWGRTRSGTTPSQLKAAVVPLLNPATCRSLYKFDLTYRMFCAGYLEGNIDTCQGDSGGPLVCVAGTQYTLIGVTSWGNGCAQPNSPGVYAKVDTVVDWIRTTMARYG